MNVYDGFFSNMSPEEWEFFAVDFLSCLGFTIIQYPARGNDGGKDALVEKDQKTWLVSCKHYHTSSSSVGVSDELSILERVIQHGANGFIGFYSTLLSEGLRDRFNGLEQNGNISVIVFDKTRISDYLPHIGAYVLQKYGIPKGIKFVTNVAPDEYEPLECMSCGKDILRDENIRSSMGMIHINRDDEYLYLYGCKSCIGGFRDEGWIEIFQALHHEQLMGWVFYVNQEIHNQKLHRDFYMYRHKFESLMLQRTFPQNWGRWIQGV